MKIGINHARGKTELPFNSLCKQWYYKIIDIWKGNQRACGQKIRETTSFRKLLFKNWGGWGKNGCSVFSLPEILARAKQPAFPRLSTDLCPLSCSAPCTLHTGTQLRFWALVGGPNLALWPALCTTPQLLVHWKSGLINEGFLSYNMHANQGIPSFHQALRIDM